MAEKCGLELNELRNESMNNNNMFHATGAQGKGYAFPKKARIDLEFRDVRFSVLEWSFRKLPGEFALISRQNSICATSVRLRTSGFAPIS